MNFLRENARWLATGILLSLGSSVGQTYFIAIFAGQIRSDYGLSDGQWGAIYTVATLTSAAMLVGFGGKADSVRLSRLAVIVALGLALAAALMALGRSVWLLLVAVFLLRFCGQGMMTHMKATAMARWFVATRGRAMAITNLGYPLGEATLPLVMIPLVVGIGWRQSWGLTSAIILFVLVPLLLWLLARDRAPKGSNQGRGAPGLYGRHWRRDEVLRHPLFYVLVPLTLTPGLIGTVVFFHSVHVAELKGWALGDLGPSYVAYAAASVIFGFLSGFLSDRFGPHRLLPIVLLPMGLAMFLIGPADSPALWAVAVMFVGVSAGFNATLSGTLWPMLFGTAHLGAVRSITTALMVVSTAIGPGVTGLLIDAGIPFPDQGSALGLWCLCLSLGLIPVSLWCQRLLAPAAN